jgi:putative hemolysin
MTLSSFADQFGVKIPPSSAQTVAGYVVERLDRLPHLGDTIVLGDYQLRVQELDQRRIARLHIEQNMKH